MSAPLFDDGKDAGALRTIGEVSAMTGVKPHVLRYWEEQFAGLAPLKRSGGRRLYRPQDVALIQRIAQLITREGYTVKGAQIALQGAVSLVRQDSPDPRSDLLPRLKRIRDQLAHALTE